MRLSAAKFKIADMNHYIYVMSFCIVLAAYWKKHGRKNPWLHQITLDVHMTIYCPSPLSFDPVPVTKSSDTQDTENTRLFEKSFSNFSRGPFRQKIA